MLRNMNRPRLKYQHGRSRDSDFGDDPRGQGVPPEVRFAECSAASDKEKWSGQILNDAQEYAFLELADEAKSEWEPGSMLERCTTGCALNAAYFRFKNSSSR